QLTAVLAFDVELVDDRGRGFKARFGVVRDEEVAVGLVDRDVGVGQGGKAVLGGAGAVYRRLAEAGRGVIDLDGVGRRVRDVDEPFGPGKVRDGDAVALSQRAEADFLDRFRFGFGFGELGRFVDGDVGAVVDVEVAAGGIEEDAGGAGAGGAR